MGKGNMGVTLPPSNSLAVTVTASWQLTGKKEEIGLESRRKYEKKNSEEEYGKETDKKEETKTHCSFFFFCFQVNCKFCFYL